jgi:predicted RNase H-like HicB family nuclease
MQDTKFIVEQTPDGFIAYPLGVQGVVVGQGDTRETALEDARSALEFHIETFGIGVLEKHS